MLEVHADESNDPSALGALERYELKESASSVPLDRIEHVADQILSSSHEERETLAALMEKMAG